MELVGPASPRFLQTAHYFARPLDFSDRCARRYGDRFLVRIYGFGDSIFLTNPRDHRAVFTADASPI